MAAPCGERCREPQRCLIQVRIPHQRQRRLGQRAGLVEYNCIYSSETLQCGGRFQQHARSNSPLVAITWTTGTANANAQGQVMIRTALAISSASPAGAPANEKPPEERQQRGEVHRRCVAACHTVGEHHETRTARFRCLDQADAFGEQGGRSGGGRGTASVAPRFSVPANTRVPGLACTGSLSPVTRLASSVDVPRSTTPSMPMRSPRPTITRSPAATEMLAAPLRAAVRLQHRDIGGTQRQQLLGRGACLAACAMVEEPPIKQEEQQRDRRGRSRCAHRLAWSAQDSCP